jgi:hypothetical protein
MTALRTLISVADIGALEAACSRAERRSLLLHFGQIHACGADEDDALCGLDRSLLSSVEASGRQARLIALTETAPMQLVPGFR